VADSLVVLARNFRIPIPPELKYDVEVKYRPSIPNNVKYWKVFEDDLELKNFLESVDEFVALHIDQDPDLKSLHMLMFSLTELIIIISCNYLATIFQKD
jgi:hypothetical protein